MGNQNILQYFHFKNLRKYFEERTNKGKNDIKIGFHKADNKYVYKVNIIGLGQGPMASLCFPAIRSAFRFHEQMGVDLKSFVFWDIIPFSPLKLNLRFGGTYQHHLQS
jgi:hypothetical protein